MMANNQMDGPGYLKKDDFRDFCQEFFENVLVDAQFDFDLFELAFTDYD